MIYKPVFNKIKLIFCLLWCIVTNAADVTTSRNKASCFSIVSQKVLVEDSIPLPDFIDINKKGNASFRADGKLDVSILATKLANGGGHVNASGGKFEDFKETIDFQEVRNYIQNKLDKL